MKKYDRKKHRRQLQRERKKAARNGQPVVAYADLKTAHFVPHVPFVVQPYDRETRFYAPKATAEAVAQTAQEFGHRLTSTGMVLIPQ